MKTIVNKLRFALLLGFVSLGMTAWSQAVPYVNKMSITTQMFLDEMAATPSLRMNAPAAADKWDRPFAAPQEVNGKVCIDAFVRMNDDRVLSELQDLGVEVQCRFKDGLITAGIPVEVLEQVAALDGVTQVEVSPLMRPTTGIARQATNTDDVLTLSSDAQAAGLSSPYDGSGVLLAVVDQGIQFSHPAFKDASGNSRIKRAIVNNTEYTSVTSNYGNSGYDHGTHTSSIAGGSSVKVSGSTVTVTNDHSQATYGGMAPGADLYLCDLNDLSGTMIANAFQKICDYADAQGQPLVVNNSWGSNFFAHDGSSNVSSVMSQYFGDTNPNHICLFAASNDAGHSYSTGYTGGYYVTGTATSSSPLGTIIRSNSTMLSNEGASGTYAKTIANAWTRATDATGIGINIHVLNASTGAILQTVTKTSSGSSTGTTANTVSLNSSYFSGTLDAYFDYVSANGKKQVLLYSTNGITARGDYLLAIEVYPLGGSSTTVDIWGGNYTFFTADLTTGGHTWKVGTDDMTIGDEASHPDVIAVGAYVTASRTSNYVGQVGDIFYQSSYATAAANPAGTIQPWITAPGAEIVAAYNYYNYSSHDYTENVVNGSVSNGYAGYGTMSGTSMAAPVASGIVAQWMQAAKSVGKVLTTGEVKTIMKETAIKDSYVTSGSNASHFGNGKIDALAGVKYILDNYASPTISPSETEVNMTAAPGSTATASVTINGYALTGGITATVSDPSNVFTVVNGSAASFKSSGTVSGLAAGDELSVTYAPTAVGNHTATVTLSSTGADDVTITLNGTATEGGAAVSGEETVCTATATNNYVPVCRETLEYNSSSTGRKYHTSQMIYPASTFSTMTAGSKIKSITFYVADGSWYTIQQSIANSTMEVRVGEVTATAVTASGLTGRTLLDSSCEVYNGVPTVSSDNKEMTFTFSGDGYTWNGGNLAIEIYVAGAYNNSQLTLPWKVAAATAGSSGHTYYNNRTSSYVTTNSSLSVLPQMTVVFEGQAPQQPTYAATVSPEALDFGSVAPNGEKELNVTIANTGDNAFTPSLSGLTAPFSTTYQPAAIPAGQSVTVPVKFAPTSTGDYNATLHIGAVESDVITADVTLTGKSTNEGSVNEATICDSTATNSYLPVHGNWYDANQQNQMLYKSTMFEGKGMNGKKITSLTFYPVDGLKFYKGSVTIKLANMPAGTAEYGSSINADSRKGTDDDFTVVKTITMPESAQTDLTEWVFDNLENEFTYTGGDLLIEVVTEAGEYSSQSFLSKSAGYYCGYVSYTNFSGQIVYQAQVILPKVKFTFEDAVATPALSVDPSEVAIEDETGDARSADVAVTSENLTGDLAVAASTNWTAALSQDGETLAVTYNGKALHQTGAATVSSEADGLTASVAADYLYAGPIYVIGDVNNYAWNTANGVQLTRDSEGIYTGTVTVQPSDGTAGYILFTKRLGSDTQYRFGPVSDGNWWLVDGTTDVYCALDTVGNLNNMRVLPGTYVITIDSKNNQFKIRPASSGSSVSPDEGTLNFGQVTAGATATQTVTITNTGDTEFTPTVTADGAFTTDYTPAALAPGESVTVTVTFAPSDEGDYNGSMTIVAGDDTYNYTLTGTATEQQEVVDNVVRSNTVTVPVYKTDIMVGAPYTEAEVEADTEMTLTPNVTNAEVAVDAKRPMAITDYMVYHHESTKSNAASDANWAVGDEEQAVAQAQHDALAGAYLPMELDAEQQPARSWVELPYVTFMNETDNSVEVRAHDNVTVAGSDTYYVPVTVADGKVTRGNTYGAPIGQSLLGSVNATVNVTYSSARNGGHWTVDGTEYCVYTPVFTVTGTLPEQVADINGNVYQRYMYRAWRVCDNARDFTRTTPASGEGALVDNGPLPRVGLLAHFGGVEDSYMIPNSTMTLGEEWDDVNGRNVKLESAFAAPVENPGITYVVRFYYKKVAAEGGNMLRAATGDEMPMYYVVDYMPNGDDLQVVTAVTEVNTGGKEVLDVTYVNTLGMTSSSPFDGVNIVVTRYTDGSTTTAKVLK